MPNDYKIKKGLDLPISGVPSAMIDEAPSPARVALTLHEYYGLKTRLKVEVGDRVTRGQCLVAHKAYEDVRFLSPAGGTVDEVIRGHRRVLQAVVVRRDESDAQVEHLFERRAVADMSREEIVGRLLLGGMWPALRTRPYSRIPDPKSTPHAIFVTAMDTRPLAAPARLIIDAEKEAFATGLSAFARLSGGLVHVCHAPEDADVMPEMHDGRTHYASFAGPHPAGLVGTHIYFIEPAVGERVVWTINYADVIAVGRLLMSGEYPVERVVALAGPSVRRPRLLRTRLGACIGELCKGELDDEHGRGTRVVAGSVLDGVEAAGGFDFLHRFAGQIAALPLTPERKLLAWGRPGLNLFSVANVLFSKLNPKREFDFDCAYNGDARIVLPIGLYERVFPLAPLATQLLKSLLVGDTDTAQKLGCLGLDEEDLAVCSYVCPGKHDFGRVLRGNLERIEKEG